MDDIILLTACINPGGMPFTVVSDATQRLNQYLLALQFYLQNTSCPIVFVDNSNMDKTPFLEYESQYGSRLEILSFDGNKVKTQGKGFGEMEIIEYALIHSKFNLLLDKHRIVKITGRLIVRNINSLLKCDKWHLYPYKSIVCHVNSDLTFADSRIFISLGSFMNLLVKQKKYLNDTKGIYFEHLLCQQIKQQKTFTFFPFITEPHFEGISGSTGIKYEKPNTSLLYKLRYLNFQMGVQKQIFCENDSCSKRLLFRVICMVITYMSSLLIKILQYKTKELA
ncbi:hypothetical protein I6E23_08225 [Prevotella brevis]|uniref:hypothetical protein n=1 Tax=Prevotella sp. P4-98 TaxID=2024219 RepID=UPI000B964CFA|nr:hypothetical protein [Prevotella sp. P4-98]MCF2559939.1 hypothetical protein [Xylanibacter brevis]OYP47924.1 hypothetical protein CIK96_01170 [Prevotella sp. P4-98]